jgi:hypothetical protein
MDDIRYAAIGFWQLAIAGAIHGRYGAALQVVLHVLYIHSRCWLQLARPCRKATFHRMYRNVVSVAA